MRRAAAILAATFACIPSYGAAATRDEICRRLDSFDRAPFYAPAGGKPAPRSVVFLWLPGKAFPNTACVHGGQSDAKALCGWLMDNTNQEFTEMLPDDILRCHGFGFPPAPNVRNWIADYDFDDDKTGRELLLEVHRGDLKDVEAIRWTVYPDGQDDAAAVPLPPVADLPEVKASSR